MYRIGVDLGGTNIVSAVVDENNKIIARANMPQANFRQKWYSMREIASIRATPTTANIA